VAFVRSRWFELDLSRLCALRFRQNEVQNAILQRCLDPVAVDVLGQCEDTLVIAIGVLVHRRLPLSQCLYDAAWQRRTSGLRLDPRRRQCRRRVQRLRREQARDWRAKRNACRGHHTELSPRSLRFSGAPGLGFGRSPFRQLRHHGHPSRTPLGSAQRCRLWR